jgi:hypothetical protein
MKEEVFKSWKPFLTGSHAYGIPGRDSDIDLVVLVTEAELTKLQVTADPPRGSEADEAYMVYTSTWSLRFGRLNLLATTQEYQFDIWRKGTKRLKRQAPVSREFAVEFFRRLREEAGLVVPREPEGGRRPRKFEDDCPF